MNRHSSACLVFFERNRKIKVTSKRFPGTTGNDLVQVDVVGKYLQRLELEALGTTHSAELR